MNPGLATISCNIGLRQTYRLWAVAATGLGGCILSLSANLWSNIDHKRKELSVLRLVGFKSLDIVCFPVVQGFLTALIGWLLAIVIYQLTSLGNTEWDGDTEVLAGLLQLPY